MAVSQRLLGRVSEALDHAREHWSDFIRASAACYEERGHCLVAMRQAPQAIAAFQQAVKLNYALPASWSMLASLHLMTGNAADSAAAADQVATLRKQPPEIVTATGLFVDEDLDRAEPLVRAYLLQHGNHVEAMRLLARIGMARKVYDDAELLLKARADACTRLQGGACGIRRDAARTATSIRMPAGNCSSCCRRIPQTGCTTRVSMPRPRWVWASCELAVSLYRELLRGTPEDADLHLSIAHALKTLGRRDEAVASYRSAAASRPGYGDAYWSLANLKTYRFTGQELEQVRAYESAPGIKPADHYHLCFALAKALEDRGEYAESFRYYMLGNALKRKESNYEPEIIERNTSRQIEVCTPEFFAARRGWGAQDPDPIFIVGLPRSGSTLIEQILASHSQVEGTQELSNIQHIVATLRGRIPTRTTPTTRACSPDSTPDSSWSWVSVI